MTVDNLIQFIRDQSSTVASNVDATTIVRYLNIAYHNVENAIADRVSESYFWDTFVADTVADQNEYSIQANDATTEGIKKIQRVEVKWKSTDWYNTLLRADTLDNYTNYTEAEAYLQAKSSVKSAWWEYRDGSLFLYPVPTEAVTGWLKISAIVALVDLASGGAETTIFPRHSELRQYHHVIWLGAVPYVIGHRYESDPWMVVASENRYRAELENMIRELNSKVSSSSELVLPSWERYY